MKPRCICFWYAITLPLFMFGIVFGASGEQTALVRKGIGLIYIKQTNPFPHWIPIALLETWKKFSAGKLENVFQPFAFSKMFPLFLGKGNGKPGSCSIPNGAAFRTYLLIDIEISCENEVSISPTLIFIFTNFSDPIKPKGNYSTSGTLSCNRSEIFSGKDQQALLIFP